MIAQICYTVLNSKSVGNSSIRYKFLSAATTDTTSYNPPTPGTTDTYTEDIQVWGVSMINLINAFGGRHLAKSYVKNADSETVAEVAIHKDDSTSLPRPWVMIKGAPGCPSYCRSAANTEAEAFTTQATCEDPPETDYEWVSGSINPLKWHFSSGIDYNAGRNHGSDTYTKFWRFPVYCKGNPTAGNFRIGVDTDDETRATWFYRPVKARGLDHGWV
jgi:hypothetical protein